MSREKIEENNKYGKTAAVIGVANLFMAPLYFLDGKLGLTASIAATTALLYGMHEVGEDRRPAQNAMNRAHNFFSSSDNRNLENGARNVISGGEAMFDEVVGAFQKKS